ncbi:MAG: M13 family metallopeptidase [Saccharofermentans sp.]|nr:M13 family metallopeptidase [Saccharofermentans sp.]
MKRFAGLTLTAAMLLSAVAGCTMPTDEAAETSETEVAELGEARPQDDYYRYINEQTLQDAEFEYGSVSAGEAFDADLINDQLESIVTDIASGSDYEIGSEEYIIKNAYDLYMAYDFENSDIPEDLAAVIERIDNCTTIEELLQIDADLVRDYGVMSFLNLAPDINPYVPEEMVMSISQTTGVMGLSFTELRDGNGTINVIKNNAQIVIMTCEDDISVAEDTATDLAYLALDIYSATDMDVIDDPMNYEYRVLYPADEIEEMYSNIDLEGYLADIGYDTSLIDEYCINDPGQIEAMNSILIDENIEALKAWELGRFYAQYSRYIAPHYPELTGYIAVDYDSKEEQAVDEVVLEFSAETDPIYVERYYSPETDEALRSMCDDIKAGYVDLISGAEWLSEETREELLIKLDNIVYVTGSDVVRHDPSEYTDVTGDNYYELYISYIRHNQNSMVTEFGDPLSRTEPMMLMQEFNACYHPSFNNITITCAITNAPFFDADANYYTNLGGLGMVIAHEMGHAFDSNCILFDSNGIYDPSWIPDEDMQTLLDRYDQAVSYFEDNFIVFGVYHVDGEKTLGENYADLGAMECITSLCSTDEELILLFENFARIWCEKTTDSAIVDQIAYDVHSPSIVRVNAILSTTDAFYEVYDVSEGDGMYIAPENRISRWY